MARGDPTYCKVDVEIFPNGEKFSTLSANEAFLYLALWALAVKVRSEDIPADISTYKWVSEWTHKGKKSVQRWMDKLTAVCLVTRNNNGSLTVHKVQSCHNKLRWDRSPLKTNKGQLELPQTRPETGGESERLRGREKNISTDPDTEIVIQSNEPAPPIRPGAVDIKKLLREAEQESEQKQIEEENRANKTKASNQPKLETEDEREVHLWFLQLWPHGEYDWDTEKDSLLSQYRKHRRGPYAYARMILIEHRKEGKNFKYGELAYLNGIAREQAKKLKR